MTTVLEDNVHVYRGTTLELLILTIRYTCDVIKKVILMIFICEIVTSHRSF